MGTRRTLAIMGAATAALALGAASAPSAHAAMENRVAEQYMIHQSGRVSWTVIIADYQQALTQEQCEELGTSAQTVFSTNEEASISFTQSSGSGASNRCTATLRAELNKTALMQTAGTTRTLTLRTAIPDSIMAVLGTTTRNVSATVFDAGIVESSDGAEIKHDSEGNGWETAEWKNVSGDLSITYDSALGNRNGRAGASPTPGSRSTPSPRSRPSAPASPSNNAAGQNPPGNSDDNTALIVAAIVVGVIVIAAVAGAVVIVMRSRRAHTGPGGYAGVPYPDGQGPGGLPGQGHGRTPGYGQAQDYGQSSGSAVPAGQSFPFGAGAVPQSPPGASAGAQTGPSAGGSASSALGLPPVPAPPKQRSPFAPDEDS